MIAIIDYGCGNILALKALDEIGLKNKVTSSQEEFKILIASYFLV